MADDKTKPFNYEDGQFICHAHLDVPEDSRQTFEDLIDVVKQLTLDSDTPWQSVSLDQQHLHVTLLRGHRAIYYHQIKHLVTILRKECSIIPKFNFFLSELKIFTNPETTKQFLCLVTNTSTNSRLNQLRTTLKSVIDNFAIKLTDEDETQDTFTHCSFMFREGAGQTCQDSATLTQSIVQKYNEIIGELPLCLIGVDKIRLNIGNHTYLIDLD